MYLLDQELGSLIDTRAAESEVAADEWRIFSIRIAFLSRTLLLGLGRASPCSSLYSAIRQRASLIILRAWSILRPCEITPGKSNTRTMNQPSSIG
jgi:hypothetical protein